MKALNDKERQGLISEINEDIVEIYPLSRNEYHDSLNDDELIELNKYLSNAWLILYKNNKRRKNLKIKTISEDTKKEQQQEQTFNKRVTEIETLFKEIENYKKK